MVASTCRNTTTSTVDGPLLTALMLKTGTIVFKEILDDALSSYMVDGNGSGRIRSLHSIGETYMNLRKAHACLLLRYLSDFAMPSKQQADGWQQLLE